VSKRGKHGRKPKLTREQSLSALPVRNTLITYHRSEAGETELIIPRRSDWLGKLMAFAFFVPSERKIILESIGSDVWELCDGEHSVNQIVDALIEKHKLNRREAETSLTEYLRKLGKRRLIAFAIPKDILEKDQSFE